MCSLSRELRVCAGFQAFCLTELSHLADRPIGQARCGPGILLCTIQIDYSE